ncbi:MAG: CDP-diacylglycerol--glycerol-3-phosphate 3-phosphatidyltransferase [Loktanella sp.]|jgi:cardiolipin synthase|nr:CDP-diacylglycerol--glycerol-3-phosphate 3-phosphatidyltransferase [Loktanella sp.]MDO7608296.1 CDP-diacylglycerol--glycerol-3-phosphate 3-phosphatidyltransferase [Loktanella sp.]MDO7624284.1 CDP-diacylglycerol--glycerol-3-phosphate 3-phosphatidyltransferase [Loktanella sp.]MDO7627547.1 CDP-diacylglycerol--glycerol-3-phosphate 3-phosphatidyltransferase [Loktanella sp.]MDO7631449.1 CDP-diacylglycerol--glycerol-3-phosphate 3-phosphatidyltransferase [Loktanella sp.]
MNWNLPNILTLLRLLAAPSVAIMFLYFNRPLADWFALLLFVSAAITDFVDGYLARAWKQETKFGAMMDPIADKAMVIIALVVITGFSGMNPWILMPAVLIIFREVFVSGLREFLGDTAGTLKVTVLAKWKTTLQMVAIAILFAKGAFEHYLIERSMGMDQDTQIGILAGDIEDLLGLRSLETGLEISWYAGVGFLWLAMILTVLSGADYFRKALPYLRDSK